MVDIHHYFDACAVVDWAFLGTGGPANEDKAGNDVKALIGKRKHFSAVSEFTLMETLDKCSRRVLGNPKGGPHTRGWYESVHRGLMTWITSGKLLVLPTAPRFAETSIRLVTHVTQTHKRQMRSWDAAHVGQATLWAREVGRPVEFCTSDKKLIDFFAKVPEFGTFLHPRNLRL